jgi:hypothetical protein
MEDAEHARATARFPAFRIRLRRRDALAEGASYWATNLADAESLAGVVHRCAGNGVEVTVWIADPDNTGDFGKEALVSTW